MICILLDSKLAIPSSFHHKLRRLASASEKRKIEIVDASKEEECFGRIAESYNEARVIYFRNLDSQSQPQSIQLQRKHFPSIDSIQVIDCCVVSETAVSIKQDAPNPLLMIGSNHLSEEAISRALSLLPELAILLNNDAWQELYRTIEKTRVFTLGYSEWFSSGCKIAAAAAHMIWRQFLSRQKKGDYSLTALRSNEKGEWDKLEPFNPEWSPPPLTGIDNLVYEEFNPKSKANLWAESMFCDLDEKINHPYISNHVVSTNRRFLSIEKGLDERTITPILRQLKEGTATLWPLKNGSRETCTIINEELKNEVGLVQKIEHSCTDVIAERLLQGKGLNELRRIGDQFRQLWNESRRRTMITAAIGLIVGVLISMKIHISPISAAIGAVSGAALGFAAYRLYLDRKRRQLDAVANQIKEAIKSRWNNIYNEELGSILNQFYSILERQVKNRMRYASLYTMRSLHNLCLSISSQIERISSADGETDTILKDKVRQRIQYSERNVSNAAGELLGQSEKILESIRQKCFEGMRHLNPDEADHDHINAVFEEIVAKFRRDQNSGLDLNTTDIQGAMGRGSLRDNAVWDDKPNQENGHSYYCLVLPHGHKINVQFAQSFSCIANHCYGDTLLAVALLPIEDTR